MTFYDVVDQARELLRQRGRLSYRALKRQFELDDAELDDLKLELIEVQGVAADERGTLLVWTGPTTGVGPPAGNRDDTPPLPAVAATPPGPSAAAALPPPADAERRQLSVLFCSLAEAALLTAALDPEDLREVLGEYHLVCAGVVERCGGVIARQVGDELLVNFGYPQAHEDDVARAVRSGLDIAAALPALNTRLTPRFPVLRTHPLQARIGMHTGPVVVGTLGASTYRDPMAVVGETPNIAARIQGLAEPDTVVVSHVTRRLLGDAFECADLGGRALKGIETPLHLYRVLSERDEADVATRASAGRHIPLVGRQEELGVLLDRWEQCAESLGHCVLLSGEAGIGKSRLVAELKAHVADEPHTLLEGRASPHHQQTAFYPWTDLLQRALRLRRGDSAETRLGKLTASMHEHGLPVAEIGPFLASLLGLSAPPGPEGALALSSRQHRQRTLDALRTLVLQLAARQPVLMIVEDLQLADPSTLEALEALLEQTATARLLLVLTARPEPQLPWANRPSITRLTLTRLRRAHVDQLVAAVTGGKALPGEVVEQVAHKTDGVPLFVEELTKMVMESGLLTEGEAGYELAGPLPPLAIPTTLQDSLMARLDRLSTTKVVAQCGAVLGRSFSYELLHAVTRLDDATLTAELSKLVQAELLHRRGMPPAATYSFKHALIQDAAYQTLLKSTRQEYHQRVGRVLETQFPEVVGGQPEVLAHHFTEAGDDARAVDYWRRAGQRAIEHSANLEAVAHLTRGLDLLDRLPATPDLVAQELTLLTALGPPLIISKGQGAPEVERTYGRARELCRQAGETPQLFPVLWGLWYFYLGRADYQAAQELSEQLLAIAEHARDPGLRLLAHRVLGQVAFFRGAFTSARAHLAEAADLYDPGQHRALVYQYAQDPGVAVRSYGALASWVLGQPHQALQQSDAALSLARDLAHPYTVAFALGGAVWLHYFRREPGETRARVAELVSLGAEQGFAYLRARGTILRGWTLAENGRPEDGIAEIRQGMAALEARGAVIWRPHWLTILAQAYGDAGNVREGLAAVAEAMAEAEKTGERWWEAETHRVRGELLLMQTAESSRLEAAQDCFHRALAVARAQQARSLELRAAVSLARCWRRQGQDDAARSLVAPIYEAFTEGSETADLQDARALLTAPAHGANL